MPIEFLIQQPGGIEDRLDRDELIEQMADNRRNEFQEEIEDQVSEFESYLCDLSDDELAKEYRTRTGEVVRIEECEEE